MFKKSAKWIIGLGLWLLGFVLMNVESSYSSTCTREAVLKKAVRSARALSGNEELRGYGFDGDRVRLQFADGSSALLDVSPKTCELLEVRVDPPRR